ncbi:MAG: hypothetical protein Phog2KO_50950 [Phototrophicaceae bacterium]
MRKYDIWRDPCTLSLLQKDFDQYAKYSSQEKATARKKEFRYIWDAETEQMFLRDPGGDKKREVPVETKREELILEAHIAVGHVSVKGTLEKLREHYFWYEMEKQTKETLEKCETCQEIRPKFLIQPRLLQTPAGLPFYQWGMDTFSIRMPETQILVHILVVVDYFTKWAEAGIMDAKSPVFISQFLFQNIICRFGVPRFFLCDNGTEFKGMVLDLCKQEGIELKISSPYHPRTNGLAERLNQTLKQGIKGRLKEKQLGETPTTGALLFSVQDLQGVLLDSLRDYNSRVKEVTGYSPFELVFIRRQVNKRDWAAYQIGQHPEESQGNLGEGSQPQGGGSGSQTLVQRREEAVLLDPVVQELSILISDRELKELSELRKRMEGRAKESIRTAQYRQQRNYSDKLQKEKRIEALKIGDSVLVRIKTSKKLVVKAQAGFRIEEIDRTGVRVKVSKGTRQSRWVALEDIATPE